MKLVSCLFLVSLVVTIRASFKTSQVEGNKKRPKSLLTQRTSEETRAPTNNALIMHATERKNPGGLLPHMLEAFPIGRREPLSLAAKYIFIIERKLKKACLCRVLGFLALHLFPLRIGMLMATLILPILSDVFWLLVTSSNEQDLANLSGSSTLLLGLMHIDCIAFIAAVEVLDLDKHLLSYFGFSFIEAAVSLFLNEILCAKMIVEGNIL